MKKQIISDEQFIEVCNNASSMLEASKKLNLSFSTFKRRALALGCYNTNQGGKGYRKEWSDGIPVEDILAGKYPDFQTYKLKIKLISAGLKNDCCELCGWNKKPEGAKYSPCELHHLDGNPHNHSLDNLIILCPNCHSLTKNYRFRKR